MVKEEKIYTTSDGKQYKTKKSAERYENELVMKKAGYTKKEVDELIKEISLKNRTIEVLLERKPDWRDISNHLIKQLPKLFEDHKNDVVTYQIVGKGYIGEEGKAMLSVRLPRLKEGEIPQKFIDYVNDLTEKDLYGTEFSLELHEEKDNVIKYIINEKTLTPEEKIAKGMHLMEVDVRELVFERPEIYEEKGEELRWTREITTVVEADDGNQYAITWEKGLTEYQENMYYNQPKRVKIEEREVVRVVKEIIYLDE